MTRWIRLALSVWASMLLFLAIAATASAHAELLGSDPADGAALDVAPTRVQLFFSEPIEPEFFTLQVYAADRLRVDRNDARISPTDARTLEVGLRDAGGGTYTVVWRALSLDGHVVRGTFAFALGGAAAPGQPLDLALPAEGAPFPLESTARWITFLTAFLLLGGFAFRPLVLDPVARFAELDGEATASIARRWLWLAWPALGILLIVSFVALLFQAASAAGIPLAEVFGGRAVSRILAATRYGWMWMVRIVLLIGIAGVLAWLTVAPRGGTLALWWIGACLSAGALLSISASGHASAVPDWTLLAILADWAHVVAGGIWIGGLALLGLALPEFLRGTDAAARRKILATLVPRFSWIAASSIVVLIASGVYTSLLHVPSWVALQDTPYGAALSGKLIVFAILLALGSINLLVMGPRFRHALARPPRKGDDSGRWRTFRWIVLGEVILGVAVLAVTGILTGLPPAGSLQLEAEPFTDTQRSANATIGLGVRPNQAGENRIEITVADERGAPLAGVERVRLTLTMLDMEMGAREVEVQPVELGRFEVEGNQLSMSGHWQAEIAVRRQSGEEQATYSFVVGQAPGANRPTLSPARIVVNALNAGSFLTIVALAGGALILARRVNLRRRDRRWATVAAAALFVVGFGVGGATVADAYRRSLPNPVPADAASLARGQEIYQESCASCHGISGRGDGPAGVMLRPRPADFRVHMAAGHTDQELFDWVTNGVQGTAMPPFKDGLTEEERWHVINYIRAFAER